MRFTTTQDKITQDKRNTLMYFNLRIGHSWYDIEKNKLYNEYGYCRNSEAKDFLLSIIDEKINHLEFNLGLKKEDRSKILNMREED